MHPATQPICYRVIILATTLQRTGANFECAVSGGGGGIRTHGDLRHTRFPSVPIRPLSHPSWSTEIYRNPAGRPEPVAAILLPSGPCARFGM